MFNYSSWRQGILMHPSSIVYRIELLGTYVSFEMNLGSHMWLGYVTTKAAFLDCSQLRRTIGVKGRPEPLKHPWGDQGWSRARALHEK